MGLGGAGNVSLVVAREKESEACKALSMGLNPIEQRKRDVGIPTFGTMADQVCDALSAGFRNAKHQAQWRSTLATYAAPLRPHPVDVITTDDVLSVLKPIWTEKPETASRVRGPILRRCWTLRRPRASARVKTRRGGGAIWTTCCLSLQSFSGAIMPRWPYEQVPQFVAFLQERESTAARALEFTILTAARSGEVFGARWREFDLEKKIWTIPSERMKAGRQHRVPLCARALLILQSIGPAEADEPFVFPERHGKQLSSMSMTMLLRRIGDRRDCSRISVKFPP